MNEYEVQSLVMQARNVKPADKFVMICILKNVNWTTWTGSVRLSYISKKYDVNRKTLTRITQRLRSLGWIKIKVKTDETSHHPGDSLIWMQPKQSKQAMIK